MGLTIWNDKNEKNMRREEHDENTRYKKHKQHKFSLLFHQQIFHYTHKTSYDDYKNGNKIYIFQIKYCFFSNFICNHICFLPFYMKPYIATKQTTTSNWQPQPSGNNRNFMKIKLPSSQSSSSQWTNTFLLPLDIKNLSKISHPKLTYEAYEWHIVA